MRNNQKIDLWFRRKEDKYNICLLFFMKNSCGTIIFYQKRLDLHESNMRKKLEVRKGN